MAAGSREAGSVTIDQYAHLLIGAGLCLWIAAIAMGWSRGRK